MQIEYLNPPGVHPPGPYTHAVSVRTNRLLFISGQIAYDRDGGLVGKGDLRAQAIQALNNLKTVLASFDADSSRVTKLTMYIVNYQYEDLPLVREALARHIDPDHPPANTLVGVQSLAFPGLLIEIEAVAALD